MNTFTIQIITPEQTLYQGEAQSVVAMGTRGLFGILVVSLRAAARKVSWVRLCFVSQRWPATQIVAGHR